VLTEQEKSQRKRRLLGIKHEPLVPAGDQFVIWLRALAKFSAEEGGATAIEYALIAGGLSIVIVAAVSGVGSSLNTIFTSVSSGLSP
jgi:pilus assembly protein Flp/PilA